MSKKPSAEEGGWAQEEESVQKATPRRAGRGCRSGKEPKKAQRRRGGWAREKKSAEKAPPRRTGRAREEESVPKAQRRRVALGIGEEKR